MSTYELASRIRNNLRTIRDYYDETLEPQRNTPSVRLPTEGDRTEKFRYARSTMRHSPPPISVEILDARRDAHEDLLHFSRVVYMACTDINGNPITTATDPFDVTALCDFLTTWADVLCRTDPDEAAGLDRDMEKHARQIHNLARPVRRDWVNIGKCPVTVADAEGNPTTCGATVRAHGYVDQDAGPIRFIVCTKCGTEDTLDWWMSQMLGNPEAKPLVTTDELISVVAQQTNVVLTHSQIRQWAARNKIPRSGKDEKGRTLFDHRVVVAIMREDEATNVG